MALRRVLILAAVGFVALAAAAALAVGPAPSLPGGLLSAPAHAMGAGGHDAMHEQIDDAGHDAMHERMREDMPAEAREVCDAHHAEHTATDR